MPTVVCPIINCPLRSANKFCQSDTAILIIGPTGLQCKTGFIAANDKQYQQEGTFNDIQRTAQGQETGNTECENNES